MAVAKGPKHAQKDAIEVAVDRRGVQQAPRYDAGEDSMPPSAGIAHAVVKMFILHGNP